jgi:hypothetical protein
MRATGPPVDAAALNRGLAELTRRVHDGRPEPVAQALWETLRAGRAEDGDGEAPVTPPSTTPGDPR